MKKRLLRALLCLGLLLALWAIRQAMAPPPPPSYTLEDLPEYSGEPVVILNENLPNFPEGDKNTSVFELYSPLDSLGRCGTAYANICTELMPTGERENIGMIRPSGWQLAKYDFVDGKYLYNRCHLIGYQLAGENANERNLVTGTRYLNTKGMLPYENQVAGYVKETGNHVLYRVTPIYDGRNLVCSGVEMEAWSVEDNGKGVCFHVYAYNVQPGVVIDYATGDNWADGTAEAAPEGNAPAKQTPESHTTSNGDATYVLNTSSKKFHLPECSGASSMNQNNRQDYYGTREELVAQGYTPCGTCKP